MIEIHEGDTRRLMTAMAPNSVNCVVTSPPYFNMRDYGVKGQLGLEVSIDSHIRTLTKVFDLVKRVLHPQGTFWLNYGDSYAETGKWGGSTSGKHRRELHGKAGPRTRLKSKDLIGLPWRIALSLQAQGWWLRSCVIWEKPSCMPESAKDRPTVSHEYVFLLTKSRHYYYDQAAIAEPRAADTNARYARARNGGYAPPGQKPHSGYAVGPRGVFKPVTGWQDGPGSHKPFEHAAGPKDIARDEMGLKPSTRFGRGAGWRNEGVPKWTDKGDRKTFRGGGKYTHSESFSPNGKANAQNGNREPQGEMRNARTVWRIPAEPTPVAHFATFPTELARRCIAAGCPPSGTAFDPFAGYGTVGLVADRLQRHAILHELNPKYIELARKRLIAESPLLCEVNVYGATAKPVRKRARDAVGGDTQGDTSAGG